MSTPQAKRRCDYTPPAYRVETVDLDIVLDDHKTVVTATLAVTAAKQNPGPLMLDGHPSIQLQDVLVDGTPWQDCTRHEESLEIRNCPAACEITTVSHIAPAENTAYEGLYKSGGAFCTQCEAEGFRRITFYPDRPDILARFTTHITAPKAEYPLLLSNGNRTGAEDLPDGLHRVSWEDPYPKPSYLFALVAGDFDCRRDSFTTRSGRRVDLELYVDRGNFDRSEQAMESLKKAMAWDEERFNLEYDLDIYMIVAVDFFNMGAMENKGLNIFNSKYVLASRETATDQDMLNIEAVIGHEYFHNWTGNRITCRDWFQLSLKEGLTVFRDQEFSSDLGSRGVNRIKNVRLLRRHQFTEDAGPMAHPIRPEEVIEMSNFYTVTIYEKGAEVIRMIHTLLGEDGFQKGMQTYISRHDGTAATCEDFVAAMEDGAGVDLSQFRRWYSQAGTPTVTAHHTWDADSRTLRLTLRQTSPRTPQGTPPQPLHIPVNTALFTREGEEIPLIAEGRPLPEVLHLQKEEQSWIFEDVAAPPVVSLMRELSAPVKVVHEQSDEDLQVLMIHESSSFTRWDACQSLLRKHLTALTEALVRRESPEVPQILHQTFASLAEDRRSDPALLAEMLTLPTEHEIAGWFETVPVEEIH
ncbi:MAG: aminopeptidase N, partial [Fibrobacterota bacterium]